MFKYSLWNARTNTEGYNLHISEWEFIIKYHGLLLLNLILPTYHGIIGIPRSPFISVRHCIMPLSVFLNRRLFRLMKKYRGIISLQIAVYFGSPMYHGIIGITISPFISVLPKYHGIGIHLISSDISSLSHMTVRLSIMVTQLSQFPKLHLIVSCPVNRTIPSSRPYLAR